MFVHLSPTYFITIIRHLVANWNVYLSSFVVNFLLSFCTFVSLSLSFYFIYSLSLSLIISTFLSLSHYFYFSFSLFLLRSLSIHPSLFFSLSLSLSTSISHYSSFSLFLSLLLSLSIHPSLSLSHFLSVCFLSILLSIFIPSYFSVTSILYLLSHVYFFLRLSVNLSPVYFLSLIDNSHEDR